MGRLDRPWCGVEASVLIASGSSHTAAIYTRIEPGRTVVVPIEVGRTGERIIRGLVHIIRPSDPTLGGDGHIHGPTPEFLVRRRPPSPRCEVADLTVDTIVTMVAVCSVPCIDDPFRDAEELGHLRDGISILDSLDRELSPPLEFGRRAVWSHTR